MAKGHPSGRARQFGLGCATLFEILERLVKPVRSRDNRDHRRINWWKHGEPQKGLYSAINKYSRLLMTPQTSPHLAIGVRANQGLYSSTAIIFVMDAWAALAALQSRPHEVWARFFASSMKDDLRYTPSDCFETFPFPRGFETNPALQAAGQAYLDHRAALMVARNEGMTKTYNRFHEANERSEDIKHLRELHAEMDRSVLRAYGWDDLAARARPEFLTEKNEDNHTYQGRLFLLSDFRDEVLARLLALNAERQAEEVRLGLAKPGVTSGRDEEAEEGLDDA